MKAAKPTAAKVTWRRIDGGYEGVGPTGRRASLEPTALRGITSIWLYAEDGTVALGVERRGSVRANKAYCADYLLP